MTTPLKKPLQEQLTDCGVLVFELRAALFHYGEHGSNCETWGPREGKCNCGLERALEMGARGRKTP